MSVVLEFLQKYWIWAAIAGGAISLLVVLLLVIKGISKGKKNKKSKKGNNGEADEREKLSVTDYELITKRILKLKGKSKSILFASGAGDSLPITIPVNAAIDLAKNKKKRCLLIDLDMKRNAAAKAFNIDDKLSIKELRPRAYKTDIEDLQIWPAGNFKRSGHMNIKPLIDNAGEKYDIVLINAPHLNCSPDRNMITSLAQYGFIFSQNIKEAKKITTLIDQSDCKTIGNMQIEEN